MALLEGMYCLFKVRLTPNTIFCMCYIRVIHAKKNCNIAIFVVKTRLILINYFDCEIFGYDAILCLCFKNSFSNNIVSWLFTTNLSQDILHFFMTQILHIQKIIFECTLSMKMFFPWDVGRHGKNQIYSEMLGKCYFIDITSLKYF